MRSTLVLHVSQCHQLEQHSLQEERGGEFHFTPLFLFQDLLNCTPSSHPDYPLLQNTQRIVQNFLSSINEETTPRTQSMTVKKGEVSVES